MEIKTPEICIERVALKAEQTEQPEKLEPQAKPQMEQEPQMEPKTERQQPKPPQPPLSRAQQILQRAQQKHKGIVPIKGAFPPPPPPPPPLRFLPAKAVVEMSTSPPPKLPEPAKVLGLDHIRASLLRKLGNDKCAFTSSGRTDGIVEQALGKITVRVMAHALGMLYTHAPFQHASQADVDVTKWEQLLGIGGTSGPIKVKPLVQFLPHVKHMECYDLNRILPCQSFMANCAYSYKDAHSFTNHYRDELHDAWRETIHELRTRYTGPKKGVFDRTSDEAATIHVAVHYESGNCDYFLDAMENLVATSPDKAFKFHIFSEAPAEEFLQRFPGSKIHFCQKPVAQRIPTQPRNHAFASRRHQKLAYENEPAQQRKERKEREEQKTLIDVFQMLVGAEVLIMSKTTLSFLAAIYSDGIKICPPDFYSVPIWCEESDNWRKHIKNP